MSGKNWLDRDPSQSPGLRRIQDATQAAAIAKVQAEQEAREAENRAGKAEQEKQEIIARIEQKTSQVLPLLEEIRDFANKTKTYPLGPLQFEKYNEPDPYSRTPLTSPFRFRNEHHIFVDDGLRFTQNVPGFIKEATISVWNYDWRILEVAYGYEGTQLKSDDREETRFSITTETPVAICYGVRLRMATIGTQTGIQIGDIDLCQQREEEIVRSGHRGWGSELETESHTLLRQEWIPLPTKPDEQKAMLAEAFHKPAYLGCYDRFKQPVEPQKDTGISGIVKGLLGLK